MNKPSQVFFDIYDILKDQRVNGNPLSNMMNRNIRIFENIKNQNKKQNNKDIHEWENIEKNCP